MGCPSLNLAHRTKGFTRVLLLGSMLVGTVMLLLMQGMTTYTTDDYYYALFLRGGLWGFLKQNFLHYLVRNGRVLVHLAAEVLLAGGSWFYSVGNTLIMAACFLLGLRYLDAERRGDRLLEACGVMALLFLGNIRVFRSWFLCPADAANYTLPLVAIFALLLSLHRDKPKESALLALLCGATTELCSMMAFAAVTLELLWLRLRRGTWDRLRCRCLVRILIGLATILLSPATMKRVGAEFSLLGVGVGFLRYANSIAAPGTSLAILVVVSLLLYAALPQGGLLRRTSIPMALLLASGWLLPRNTLFTALVFALFCLWLLLCAVTMILADQNRRCGYVLLMGLASAAITTLSSSGSVRLTIPFVLCLIIVGGHLLSRVSLQTGRSLRIAAAVLLWAAMLLQLPTAAGIAGNWQIMRANAKTLAETPATYCDYDPRYCTQQIFLSQKHQGLYLQNLGLSNVDVRYTRSAGPDILLGDELQPTVYYRDQLYIPLRAAVEAHGGTVSFISDGLLEIRLGQQCWIYQDPVLYGPNGTREVIWDFVNIEDRFHISLSVLTEELGIQITLPED